eukprot:17754-Eustigmatos_ZCMA.PRE.1
MASSDVDTGDVDVHLSLILAGSYTHLVQNEARLQGFVLWRREPIWRICPPEVVLKMICSR